MKKLVLISVVWVMFSSANLFASPAQDTTYLKNTLQLMADKTLEAYNYEDYLAFFKYYSNTVSRLKTKKYFDNLFMDVYKGRFGEILSKELVEGESSFDPYYPRLTYKAKCRSQDQVLITINFQEESGTYRINRITFDRMPKALDY